jgi:hypothetical protein
MRHHSLSEPVLVSVQWYENKEKILVLNKSC